MPPGDAGAAQTRAGSPPASPGVHLRPLALSELAASRLPVSFTAEPWCQTNCSVKKRKQRIVRKKRCVKCDQQALRVLQGVGAALQGPVLARGFRGARRRKQP